MADEKRALQRFVRPDTFSLPLFHDKYGDQVTNLRPAWEKAVDAFLHSFFAHLQLKEEVMQTESDALRGGTLIGFLWFKAFMRVMSRLRKAQKDASASASWSALWLAWQAVRRTWLQREPFFANRAKAQRKAAIHYIVSRTKGERERTRLLVHKRLQGTITKAELNELKAVVHEHEYGILPQLQSPFKDLSWLEHLSTIIDWNGSNYQWTPELRSWAYGWARDMGIPVRNAKQERITWTTEILATNLIDLATAPLQELLAWFRDPVLRHAGRISWAYDAIATPALFYAIQRAAWFLYSPHDQLQDEKRAVSAMTADAYQDQKHDGKDFVFTRVTTLAEYIAWPGAKQVPLDRDIKRTQGVLRQSADLYRDYARPKIRTAISSVEAAWNQPEVASIIAKYAMGGAVAQFRRRMRKMPVPKSPL
jgi:hypothetical protein